ncbi:MAG: hypothetical protein QGG50_06965 [Methanopyri archaeon]|nr:hypothetical protein [Methanopyri archaeon]
MGKFMNCLTIGIGQAGNLAVNNLYSSGASSDVEATVKKVTGERWDYFRPILVNTDETDLAQAKNISKNNKIHVSAHGAGGKFDWGVRIARAHEDILFQRIRALTVEQGFKPNFVFLIHSLGGGTGSGFTPIIAEIAERIRYEAGMGENEFSIVDVPFLPFRYQKGDIEDNIIQCLNEMLRKVDGVLMVDLEHFYERIPPQYKHDPNNPLTVDKLLEAVDMDAMMAIRLLTVFGSGTSSVIEGQVADVADIKATISSGAFSVIGVNRTPVDDKGNPSVGIPHLVRATMVEKMSASSDFKKANGALLLIKGPKAPSIKDMRTAIDIIHQEIGEKTVREAYAIIPNADKYEVVLILAGVTLTRLEKILDDVEERKQGGG